MESVSNVVKFLEGKTILVTGGTGFLAKIFVEKILRIQPNVKKLFLVVRAADTKSANQRMLKEMVEKDLFRVLKEKWGANMDSFISKKMAAVPGDVALENLGVRDSDLREEMWREIDIVANFAATTDFCERYDVALDTNTMGALHVLNFAKKCPKIKMLLHVSTAYVCGETPGLISEKPFDMGETLNGTCKLDIISEMKLAEEKLNQLHIENATKETITSTMNDLGIKRARLYGWPNTYVFTKAMGEMLLGYSKGNLPLVIIRPTMITSTYREPFPGWIEGLRTVDAPIVGFGKGKLQCLVANPDTILDMIPADMVVNSVIMGMVTNVNQTCQKIYHVSSSMRNPITISDLVEYMSHYFIKYPYIDKLGKPVIVKKPTILDTAAGFKTHMALRYVFPLKGLKLVNTIFCRFYNDICNEFDQKIKFVTRLAELYEPYMFFKGIFDDTNSERLRMAIRGSEVEMDALFNFDPNCIDWKDYLTKTHVPGLIRYVVKK